MKLKNLNLCLFGRHKYMFMLNGTSLRMAKKGELKTSDYDTFLSYRDFACIKCGLNWRFDKNMKLLIDKNYTLHIL